MINYLLEFTIYWLILLMGYEVLLSKLPKFHTNRMLLWVSFIFSAVLPLVPRINLVQQTNLPNIQLPAVWVEGQNTIHAANEATSSFHLLPWLAGLVALVLFARLAYGILQIRLLNGRSNRSLWEGYQLYTSAAIKEPFSFWTSVYLPQYHSFNQEEMDHILRHETGHIRHWHSLDNIIMEVIQCFLWWNPLFYFFRKKLREIHEFQADQVVTFAGNWQPYGRFLVSHGVSFSHIPLAQTIFAHPLQKRIKMLKKSQNQKNYSRYYWGILPILGLCVILHACSEKENLDAVQSTSASAGNEFPESYTQTDTIVTFDPTTGKEDVRIVSQTEDYYIDVDEKPRFPGCEDQSLTGEALDECSTKEFLNWIYKRVKYPEEAKKAGAEGMALVKFIVTKEGNIDRIRLAKDPGSGMGEAAMATAKEMISEQIQWRPGMKDGSAVNVEFTLPIRFKLQ